MTMTFDEFAASRVWSENLPAALPDEAWGMSDDSPVPVGYVYAGQLYIEAITNDWPEVIRARGAWHLTLGNWERASDSLEELERTLYQYAVDEEIVEREPDQSRCQHRDDGRGRCIDCGAFL